MNINAKYNIPVIILQKFKLGSWSMLTRQLKIIEAVFIVLGQVGISFGAFPEQMLSF